MCGLDKAVLNYLAIARGILIRQPPRRNGGIIWNKKFSALVFMMGYAIAASALAKEFERRAVLLLPKLQARYLLQTIQDRRLIYQYDNLSEEDFLRLNNADQLEKARNFVRLVPAQSLLLLSSRQERARIAAFFGTTLVQFDNLSPFKKSELAVAYVAWLGAAKALVYTKKLQQEKDRYFNHLGQLRLSPSFWSGTGRG